jgi:orotidine-5'-phosphate decarboxylase
VGIDPSASLLSDWGRSDSVEGLEYFSLLVLDAANGVAAAIKPQVAYFERFGSAGFRVLERLLEEARDADVLTIADAKRGDIGDTNAGYASAWLDERSPLRADAVTVSPYLGVGALSTIFNVASANGRGVFVLAATSNDEGRSIQRARTNDGEFIEDLILRELRERNQREAGLGALGAVVGATRNRPDFDLATLQGPYLVPGVGAQGAGATDVAKLFEQCPKGSVLVNVGRAILSKGPEKAGLRDAAQRWRDELIDALL